jgi:hypothetical protein
MMQMHTAEHPVLWVTERKRERGRERNQEKELKTERNKVGMNMKMNVVARMHVL